MQTQLYGKDFITTEDWTNEELETALDMATDLKRRFLAGEPHDHLLRAKTLYMLFFEESTRTRTSFETGMTQLGGHGVFLTPKATQIDHGENAQDTGTVLSRYGHGIAVRDCRTNIGQKYLYDLAKYANIPIFSMQDDVDHPCQTMADLIWLEERMGDLAGRRIAVSWAYSPSYAKPLSVPQGLVTLLTRVGAEVTLAHPPGYELLDECTAAALDNTRGGGSFRVVDDMDEAFRDADVVYPKSWGAHDLMLERVGANAARDTAAMAAIEERALARNAGFSDWICDERRMALTDDALYLHCLPADIGAEVSPGVMERFTVDVAREANWKVYVVMALLAGAKVPDLAARLTEIWEDVR